MKKCPICKCGAEFTNKVEYYAKQAGGFAVGVGVGFCAGLFVGNHGAHVGNEVKKNLTEEVKKRYKCTNPVCGHVWYEE